MTYGKAPETKRKPGYGEQLDEGIDRKTVTDPNPTPDNSIPDGISNKPRHPRSKPHKS